MGKTIGHIAAAIITVTTLGIGAGTANATPITGMADTQTGTVHTQQAAQDATFWTNLRAIATYTSTRLSEHNGASNATPRFIDTFDGNKPDTIVLPAGFDSFAGTSKDDNGDTATWSVHVDISSTEHAAPITATTWSKNGKEQAAQEGADTQTITVTSPTGETRAWAFTLRQAADKPEQDEATGWNGLKATLHLVTKVTDGGGTSGRDTPITGFDPANPGTVNLTTDMTNGQPTFGGSNGKASDECTVSIDNLPDGWTAATTWSKDGKTQDTNDGADTQTITVTSPTGTSRTYTFTFRTGGNNTGKDNTTSDTGDTGTPSTPDTPGQDSKPTGQPDATKPGSTLNGTMPTDPQVEHPDNTKQDGDKLANTGVEATFGPLSIIMLISGVIAAVIGRIIQRKRQ